MCREEPGALSQKCREGLPQHSLPARQVSQEEPGALSQKCPEEGLPGHGLPARQVSREEPGALGQKCPEGSAQHSLPARGALRGQASLLSWAPCRAGGCSLEQQRVGGPSHDLSAFRHTPAAQDLLI